MRGIGFFIGALAVVAILIAVLYYLRRSKWQKGEAAEKPALHKVAGEVLKEMFVPKRPNKEDQ